MRLLQMWLYVPPSRRYIQQGLRDLLALARAPDADIDVEELRCSVLLPSRPSADLRDLLQEAGIGLVFRDRGQFDFEFAGTPRTAPAAASTRG